MPGHEDVIKKLTCSVTSHTSFWAAATVKDLDLYTYFTPLQFPTNNCQIVGAYLEVTELFAGTGITSCTLGLTRLSLGAVTVVALGNARVAGNIIGQGTESLANFQIFGPSDHLYVRCTANVNTSNLTQGHVTVHIAYIQHVY